MSPRGSTSSPVALVRGFGRARVLVVGDLMLDEFMWGKVSRISPEAPVPIVWVQSESVMPGGAANVASNICALGGRVSVVGLAGEDRWGDVLRGELAARQIEMSGIVLSVRPTIVKTRVIAHHQQVVRVDREQKEPLPAGTVDRLIRAVTERLDEADAVVIEDYGKGVVCRQLLEAVIPLARRRGKLITVDPKEDHFDLYRRVTALTPNRAEAGAALGRELESDVDVARAGEELLRKLECEALLITLGEEGMSLFERGGRHVRIPTVAQEVFDVAGAGDTVIATFTLALASGASMEQAARVANQAAGIVIGKLGVATASPEELLARLSSHAAAPGSTRRGRLPAPRSGQRRARQAGRPLSSRR